MTNGRQLYSDPSWTIEFSPEENCLVVYTTDYHAGPLKLTAVQWQSLAQQFAPDMIIKEGPTVLAAAKTKEQRPPTEPGKEDTAGSGGTARSGDRTVVARNEALIVSVSSREKRVFVQCAGSESSPLEISRRELYRIGKSMGKRGRRREARLK